MFRSSIPATARARIVERHSSGAQARVEYVLGKSVVGYRDFDSNGELELDCGLRTGRPHGTTYRLDSPGKLVSATPYRNGLEHGLARQWSEDGLLIGSYRMQNGTGVILWWEETCGKPRCPYLAEVRFLLKGRLHGYEWWLNEDQVSVHKERYWSKGELHGIGREWNDKGVMRSSFPRFHVRGNRVTRQVYERARATDASLPAFRPTDDRPERVFPTVVARRLVAPTKVESRRAR